MLPFTADTCARALIAASDHFEIPVQRVVAVRSGVNRKPVSIAAAAVSQACQVPLIRCARAFEVGAPKIRQARERKPAKFDAAVRYVVSQLTGQPGPEAPLDPRDLATKAAAGLQAAPAPAFGARTQALAAQTAEEPTLPVEPGQIPGEDVGAVRARVQGALTLARRVEAKATTASPARSGGRGGGIFDQPTPARPTTPEPTRARVSDEERRLIDEAIAAGKVTRIEKGAAAGLSGYERQFHAAPPPLPEGGWKKLGELKRAAGVAAHHRAQAEGRS